MQIADNLQRVHELNILQKEPCSTGLAQISHIGDGSSSSLESDRSLSISPGSGATGDMAGRLGSYFSTEVWLVGGSLSVSFDDCL